MKTIFRHLPLIALLAFAIPITPTFAADKPAASKTETKERALGFYGTVVSVSDKVVTLKGTKGDRKYNLGPESKVLNNSEEQKAATIAEVKAGSYVTGSYYKQADGTHLIHHLYVAPKKKEKEPAASKSGSSTDTSTSTDSSTTDKKKKKKSSTDSSSTTTTKSSQ